MKNTGIRPRVSASSLFFGILIFFFAYQILVGIIWMACNLQAVPVYGDSAEYVKLSQTMAIDQYRGVLYPLLLRTFLFIEQVSGIPYQCMVYILQVAVSFIAWYVVAQLTFGPMLEGTPWKEFPPSKKKWIQVFFSLVVITNPFIAHFNLTILVDSLALSTLAVFCGFVFVICSGNRVLVRSIAAAIVCFVCSSLLRSERLYIHLGICAVCALLMIFAYRGRQNYKHLLGLLAVCAVSAPIVLVINSLTQISEDYRRPPLTLLMTIFSQCAWPRLEAVYPYLEPRIQQMFTLEQAQLFDEAQVNILYYFLYDVSHGDWSVLPEFYRSVTVSCLRYFWMDIVGTVVSYIAFYLSIPVSAVLDFHSLITGGKTLRTFNIMSAQTPLLSAVYFYPFLYLYPALCCGAVVQAVGKLGRRCVPVFAGMAPLIVASMGTAFSFSISAIVGYPNIRFGLINYATWIALGFCIFLKRGLSVKPFEQCAEKRGRQSGGNGAR